MWHPSQKPCFRALGIAVFTMLLSIDPSYAAPSLDDIIATASAERRVGYPDRAIEILDKAHGLDGESQKIARVIRLASLVDLRRFEDAKKLLRHVQSRELTLAVHQIGVRIALGLGDSKAAKLAIGRLLKNDSLSVSARHLAQYQLASLLASGPSGDRARSRQILEMLSEQAQDRSMIAGALALRAQIGDERARKRLLIEFPATTVARTMAQNAKLNLTHDELKRRVNQLFAMRAYDLAEPNYLALLRSDSATLRQDAQLKLAIIRMRLRERYPESVTYLEKAMTGPDAQLAETARYRYGLALGYLGRFREASQIMKEFIPTGSRRRRSVYARYQVGRLLHEAGHFDEALADHRRFLATRPPDRPKWIWFEGWTLYRKGDFSGAFKVFETIAKHKNTLVGAKALYWMGRCQAQLGNQSKARRVFRTLERRAGTSYYGFLGNLHQNTLMPRRIQRQEPLAAPHKLPYIKRLSSSTRRAVRTVYALSRAGFIGLARGVYRHHRLSKVLRRQLGSRRGRALKKVLSLWLEDWGKTWGRQSRKQRRLPWREGFDKLSNQQRVSALPPAYLALARAAGRPYDVSPWWLLSHMLQESRYQEKARSHALALGPMQIIPRTGRIIANQIGFPRGDFLDEELFVPGVALRQAAWYLAQLRDEYRGSMHLAMAAYNGGPRRMTQHVKIRGKLPFPEMIEEIGAHETRNYVRKIMDHLVRYLELYATDEEREAGLKALQMPVDAIVPKMKIRF